MKLPGSLIKKRANAIEKHKTHTKTTLVYKDTSVPMQSPIHSPVSMSSAPAEIKYIDSTAETMSKITPVVDMMINKLEQLEKKHSPPPEPVITASSVTDTVKPTVVPAIVPEPVVHEPIAPALSEADLQKKSKPELMSLCSTNKVYVKLPATRKVLIAAILDQQKTDRDNKDNMVVGI